MHISKDINSKDYWDQRFSSDWVDAGGVEQSRFFAHTALQALPGWMRTLIRTENMSVCDWGCAQGDGTDVLRSELGVNKVVGIDFSETAINQAAARYPGIQFLAQDWLSQPTTTSKQFDVVFSSNTLEHFARPYDVLSQISAHAGKMLILALPFRETIRISEHEYTFRPENIPLIPEKDWMLVFSRVIDCTQLTPCYWPGEQIVMAYVHLNWEAVSGLRLTDINIARDEITVDDLRKEIANINQAAAERDMQFNQAVTERDAQINQAAAERDMQIKQAITERDAVLAEISFIRSSKLFRLAHLMQVTRWIVINRGLSDYDRAHLKGLLRGTYQKMPSPIKNTLKWGYEKFVTNPSKVIHRRVFADTQFQPPALRPSEQLDGRPDYIVWGVIDWHFRHQRPQHLAQAFAASGRRVFYVSSNLTDRERGGFDLEALDASGRLFQVKLYANGAPSIYTAPPGVDVITQLRASVGELLLWADSSEVVSLVQHAFWYDVATVLPNSRVVYDCMDHHEGFGNTAPEILALERSLLRDADLTVTTSGWLDQIVANQTKRRALIRNAGEFEHFATCPASIYRDPQGRRVIGYYGAIAEWFDQELVEAIAHRFPDCCVLLVGADTVNSKSKLGHLANVKFIGEVSYGELPYYLHGFAVCLLPFKVIPLTLATNPVKVYEYLSAGKVVVSVDLPEMRQFSDLVSVADSPEGFLSAVADILSRPFDQEDINKRQAFAKEQTWTHRAEALVFHVEHEVALPKASVIVVTYNNIELTKACLESLDKYSAYSELEIIVVDNASSDGSGAFLAEWVKAAPNRKIILNEDNKGFAAANNQGLVLASGEYLVLLNNDTYVTPGWIGTLINHLRRDNTIGLIGPVTNNIGNEAKINISFTGMEDMLKVSAVHTRRHLGQTMQLHNVAFFCVMMRRDVYERVGPLDEIFGKGFFEDDDYCRRVEQLGLRVVCAEDVFIYHHLSASFNKLRSKDRQALFEQNKATYEAKWGEWVPHDYRNSPSDVMAQKTS
jgi:GT2 family glycosyltransferase/glycosyltransferase involved in cell wall biosynthesis